MPRLPHRTVLCRAGRRAFAVGDVCAALFGIFIGGGQISRRSVVGRFKQRPQERSAPTTARSSTKTVGDLTGSSWSLDADEIDDLPLGDVKTETKFIVKFHGVFFLTRGETGGVTGNSLS